MKSVVVGTESRSGSKSKRFGFGYEKKSANRPSIQTARAEFLSLILELRPTVVSNLFCSAYPPFTQMLAKNEAVVASLCESLESEIPVEAHILRQPDYIRERAIKKLLPNWRSLQQRDDAESLQRALERWAQDHNLTTDWCLDHALEFLRKFESLEYKDLAFSLLPDAHFVTDLIRRAWQSASVERHCAGLLTQFHSNSEVEDRGLFSFTFNYETLTFNVTGPFYKSVPSFKEEVERSFVALGGPSIRGARKALRYLQTAYLDDVERVMKELGLEEPPVRWASGDHFEWLLNYQLPPCRGCREIGREFGKDEATVREGIQDIATIIGLRLRPADRGRPKGIQDGRPRHRAARA